MKEDQMEKQTQLTQFHYMEDNVSRSELQTCNDYNAKCLAMLPKFQHVWDENVGQIKSGKNRIKPV